MAESTTKYTGGLGRRKEAVALVRLITGGSGKITVNGKDAKVYFPLFTHQQKVHAPFVATGTDGTYDVTVSVKGGGITGQADAVRLGIARALVEISLDYRAVLKKSGYLSRDARVRERKKYGHLSARRSPQWSKR